MTDSSPTRSALISILPLIPPSKRELSGLSTPDNPEREAFSVTSVKSGAKASLAAPFAALQDSRAAGGPAPGRRVTFPLSWSTCSQTHGDLPRAAQDPDGAGRTEVRMLGSAASPGREYPGAAPALVKRPKGQRVARAPSARRGRPPRPHPPLQAPERKVEGRRRKGRSRVSSPTPLECSRQGWSPRGSLNLPGIHPRTSPQPGH